MPQARKKHVYRRQNMKKLPKITFLMAAHNEEKIIGTALEALVTLPYPNYEVLIGLDGCTDATEEVVKHYKKRSKKIKHYVMDYRSGKPPVINALATKAKGDLFIIHDADWVFQADKEGMLKMISLFEDPKIGGIIESFPVSCTNEVLSALQKGKKHQKYSLAHLSSAWFSLTTMLLDRKKISKPYKNHLILDTRKLHLALHPILVNVFRRELFKSNETLADDIERTFDIVTSNHHLVYAPSIAMPRMIAAYTTMRYPDIYKQKKRTALARRQVKTKYAESPTFAKSSNTPFFAIITRLLRVKDLQLLGGIITYMSVVMSASVSGKILQATTKEGWTLRAQR